MQAQLTTWIKQTYMPQQLLELLQQHSASIDHINVSAAFIRARKRLCRTGVLPEQQPAAVQQLLQHLHQLAEEQQQQFSARSLANIMSACGHMRMKSTVQLLLPDFLQDSKLQQAKPQEVSSTLWAVATLGVQLTEDQVQQLVQEFVDALPRADPQSVANTLWSVAKMGHTLPAHQLSKLLQRVQQLLQQLQPADIAGTLVACASMQYVPLPLLSALEQQPASGLPLVYSIAAGAKPQELANMALACGQLGYSSTLLPGVVLQQAVLLLQEALLLQNSTKRSTLKLTMRDMCRVDFTMHELCDLCCSAALLDLPQYVPQVLTLASACACAELWATATALELQQLYQVHLWLLDSKLSMSAPDQGLSGVLSQQQLQQCKDSWEQQLQRETASAKASDLHRSVFAALQALPADTWQQPPVLEQRTADGALSIDIAATTRSGVQLAVEVDGPSQLVQPACTHSGPTLFRNRALAARGYVLVSIPHWMWRSWRDAPQQQQYLLSELQKAEQAALLQPTV
jgi:hypothetical protein